MLGIVCWVKASLSSKSLETRKVAFKSDPNLILELGGQLGFLDHPTQPGYARQVLSNSSPCWKSCEEHLHSINEPNYRLLRN